MTVSQTIFVMLSEKINIRCKTKLHKLQNLKKPIVLLTVRSKMKNKTNKELVSESVLTQSSVRYSKLLLEITAKSLQSFPL